MLQRIKIMRILAIAIALGGFAVNTSANSHNVTIKKILKNKFGKAPTPDGFDNFLVYMAAGTFNPNIPHPTVPGCVNLFCDGAYFQEKVMGRSPSEIEQEIESAKEFFLERFGADLDSPDSGMVLNSFFVDPRKEYRAYVISGKRVPSRGYVVRDGGIMAVVVNPEGLVLGGEFEGVWVPPGTAIVFGNYNILVDRTFKTPSGRVFKKGSEIVIRYKAAGPIFVTPEGFFEITCELEHEEWGSGLAQGNWKPQLLEDGRIKSFVRNILTFPGLGEIPPM